MNNNRRELPNVPRNTTNIDNKLSTVSSQNPFYNSSTTANPNSTRSTPSQWMGNIGQTLRRQSSNVADVKLIPFFFLIFEFFFFCQ